MKYMLLLADAPDAGPTEGTPEAGAEMSEWFAYDQMLRDAGVFVEGEALTPIETALTVRVRDGTTVVTDGPFAEAKEVIGLRSGGVLVHQRIRATLHPACISRMVNQLVL